MSSKKGLFNTTDMVFPTALGLKYHLTNAIDLGLEASMRFTATDKFDAVVDNAPRTYDATFQATTTNTGKNTLATSRYQGYAYDKYALLGFKVSYKLGCCKPTNQNIEWHDPQENILRNVEAEMGKLKSLLNDSDKDGVSDAFDKEPNTPAGVRVDGAGQALDVDGDGVPDYKDDEPFSPKGASVNETGVAVDSDNDGVPDVRDLEANSKPGALVNFRGITIGQRDVPVASSQEHQPLFVFPSVYFDLNSAAILPQYYDILTDAARNLILDPTMKIDIYGNCDVRGNDAINNELGKRRAEAVANFLIKHYNISKDRIKMVESLGKQHPVSDQHRPNRRVDIILAK
jgi:OOP family OmpA-OmpF porin